jgi:CBS domain-containing protein
MNCIREILRDKEDGHPLVATHPGATVLEATLLMNEHRTGSVLVMSGGRLVGIFTERDVLRRIVADRRSPEATPVREVMTDDVVCCGLDATVDEVADVMRFRRIRHVPVVDADGSVVGLVSIGDINAHRVCNCEVALHQVEDYIHRRA